MNVKKLTSLSSEEKISLGLKYAVILITNCRELWSNIKLDENNTQELYKLTHKSYRISKRMRKLFRCMNKSEMDEFIKKEFHFITHYYEDDDFYSDAILKILKSLATNRGLEEFER